jgi:hypothetical protein
MFSRHRALDSISSIKKEKKKYQSKFWRSFTVKTRGGDSIQESQGETVTEAKIVFQKDSSSSEVKEYG